MGTGLDIVIGVAERTLKNGMENLLKIIGEVKISVNNRLDESEVKLMAHFVHKNVLRCLHLRTSHKKCFLQFYWGKGLFTRKELHKNIVQSVYMQDTRFLEIVNKILLKMLNLNIEIL